jgi:hypothetical protein
MEQKASIDFLLALGKTRAQKHEMLKMICEIEYLSHVFVCELFERFGERCEWLEDYPRCGLPSTTRNRETTGIVIELVARGGRMILN